MKHKILITALIAIGFSLSGVIHAVPIPVTNPDGSKAVANVEGNKLMLRDATGKLWLPAGDGTYKTSDGKAIIVKGGIIGPLDNKDKTGVIAPMFTPPAAQSGNAGAPAGNTGAGNIVGPMFTPPAVQSGNATAPIGNKINAGANAPKLNPAKIPEGNTSGLPGAPGVVAHPTAGCPDPAVTGLHVNHWNRNDDGTYDFVLRAMVINKGSVPFVSRSNQQTLTFNEGARVLYSTPWLRPGYTQLAAGASFMFNSPSIRWYPSNEFPADFSVQIIYDPDIFIDDNPQNDDCVMTNNKFTLTADEVRRRLTRVVR